eukprot:242256_1
MSAEDVEMNNLFRGDFILHQTEVTFYKKKKNKKKQQTPKQCLLLITNNNVAFTDINNTNKELLTFPRTTITDFKYNQNTNINSAQYLFEISVFIKNKTHQICIEFPPNNTNKQTQKFIEYFTNDKNKNNNNNHTNTNQHIPINIPTNNNNNITQLNGTDNRTNVTLNEETLRKRANQLAKHKYLATLYKTLVGKNILTPDEFWDEYGKDMNNNKNQNDNIKVGMSNDALQSTINNEEWSLFKVFKDDINNNEQNDINNNKLTINLTPDKILQIFINLPQVKLAYDKHVPHNFSEEEFWKSFLQSHYFKKGTSKNMNINNNTETEMDKLLKKYMAQIESEKDNINSEDTKINDNDIDMIDRDETGRIKANKPLKRRFKKKMHKLDPSVDLTATMQSFTEIIQDPGIEQHKHLKRDQVQNWFNQVNKHGTMLLYQSLNQKHVSNNDGNENIQEIMSNVPKVNYGRHDTVVDEDTKMSGQNDEHDANLGVMDMDYSERLNVEGEFDDLKEQTGHNYIELKIQDQSAYWGKDLLLDDNELDEMNEYSIKLCDYFDLVEKQKKKLYEQEVKTLISLRYVQTTLLMNTENNFATGGANLLSEKIIENRRKNNIGVECECEEEVFMIFTQHKEIKANSKIMEKISEFLKPMKELVRHYWHCFPLNEQRLGKAKIIVDNLKEYKGELIKCQMSLDKKSDMDKKMQRILLRELIELADKVLEHDRIRQNKC